MKRILAIEKCGLYCGGAVNMMNWVEYYTVNDKADVDVLVGENGDFIKKLSKTKANLIDIPLPNNLQKYGKKVLKIENLVKTLYSLISYNFQVIKELSHRKYDKVVFNSYRTSVFYSLFLIYLRLFTKSKVILRLQISETPIKPFFNVVCWLSHSIIVHGTSGYCKREFGNDFFNREKTICLPNPVDVDKFKFNSKMRSKLRDELGIDSQTIVLLSVCHVEPRKGVLELIEAFTESAPENMVLVHVGGHEEQEEYYERVVNKANDKVFLLGKRSDIENIYSMADVFVLYSKYEGMPYVIIEAMASSLPIISTYAGSNSDVVTNQLGFLIDFGDDKALKNLILKCSVANLNVLGANSRKNAVMHYSDKHYYEKISELI